jgi:hypothetical protein
LIRSSAPPAFPCNNRDGVSNPLESKKISSLMSSAATIVVFVAAGIDETGSARQLPGVMTSTRLATSARLTTTRRSRVQA